MAEAVLMPKVGISVESCIITEWIKQPGDPVAIGDILFGYETDKSSLECESTAAGTLLEQFYAEGDEVPVLAAVCAVGSAGEDVSDLRPGGVGQGAGGAQPAAAPPAPALPAPAATAAPAPQAAPITQAPAQAMQGEAKISPRAKNLAAKLGLNAAEAAPTGPYGRVIERDVRAIKEQGGGMGGRLLHGEAPVSPPAPATPPANAAGAAAPPPPAGTAYTDEKFSGIRRAISQSMSQSLAEIPQLTHSFSFDAGCILAWRAMAKQGGQAGAANVTLNDIVLYAVSRVLPKYPALNAHMLDGTTIRKFEDVNLGMAVDTPRGLMVPVIFGANHLSLAELAAEAKRLAAEAQAGSLSPDYMTGGTFTVSNLGTLGVEHFTPVINPPQTGILGVNTITQRPRAGKDGGIELYPAMGISLTYDHRAIDGAPASRFAQELCQTLEQFTLLLAQ